MDRSRCLSKETITHSVFGRQGAGRGTGEHEGCERVAAEAGWGAARGGRSERILMLAGEAEGGCGEGEGRAAAVFGV